MEKTGHNIECKTCGKHFYVAKWQIESGVKYCSSDCYHLSTRGKQTWNTGTKGVMKPNQTSFKKGQTIGENNHNWKGGITHDEYRFKDEYKEWRTKVFERDNYTCVFCNQKGGELQVDHIKPQSLFPDLRLDVANGRTLCVKCHKKTFSYLNKYMSRNDFLASPLFFTKKDITLNLQKEPSDDKYRCFDDGGVEVEVGELLYSLVRMIKPHNILETGLYSAISTMYMAQALCENGGGLIDTVEFEVTHVKRSRERLEKLGLVDFVNIHHKSSMNFTPPHNYQMMLLDTEPQLRFAELVKFYDYLEPGGFVFIHDLHRHMGQMPNEEHGFAWPWGKIPNEIKEWVKTDKLRPFHFATPRGLTGFYKPEPGDYKWTS